MILASTKFQSLSKPWEKLTLRLHPTSPRLPALLLGVAVSGGVDVVGVTVDVVVVVVRIWRNPWEMLLKWATGSRYEAKYVFSLA